MIDERELLERAVRRFEPEPGLTDRVYRRRDRKRRNQRIASGAVGIAVFVAAVWIVTSVGSLDRTQAPAGEGTTDPTETGPSVVPGPDVKGIGGLPPEGATPSTPESGELVVKLGDPGVWVYADGRVISRVSLRDLEPYSGLVEQHLTPEGVEFLQSTVLSTGLFEHDLDLASGDPMCCVDISVRDGDRLVSLRWGPRYALSDRGAPQATPEQAAALESLEVLLTNPESWPASVWTDQQIRAYVPTSYSFCSRWAEPSRVVALLPEEAGELLGAGYLKSDGSTDGTEVHCSRITTEETRALAGILIAQTGDEDGPSLGFAFDNPGEPLVLIAVNPVLPHGESAGLAGLG